MNSSRIEHITRFYGYSFINPLVCALGIIFNIVNLTVLSSRRLKESPYTYLTGLACFDLLTMLSTFYMTFTRGCWLKYYKKHEYSIMKLERLFFLPSANLFSAISVTITVALTVERYFFVKFPMHVTTYCSPTNAKRTIAVIFIIVLLFRLPMYFFSDVVQLCQTTVQQSSLNNNSFSLLNYSGLISQNCIQKVLVVKKYEKFHSFYFGLSFIIFEIVPFFVLSLLNLNLLLLLKKSNKEIEKLNNNSYNCYQLMARDTVSQARPSHQFDMSEYSLKRNDSEYKYLVMRSGSDWSNFKVNSTNFPHSIRSKRKKSEMKLTRTLISVVFLVLLSEISSIVTYDKITEFLVGEYYPNYMKSGYNLQVFISNLIVLMIHSVNFFLYCAFNRKYLSIFKQKYQFFFNIFKQ
jgi:hypothetical protein